MHRRLFGTIALGGLLAAAGPAARQEEPRYPAIGAGHFVTAIREEGRFVTLEDKSQWEIEAPDRHRTVAWQELEGIAVRWAGGSNAFTYQIVNLDRDEGASARWMRPGR